MRYKLDVVMAELGYQFKEMGIDFSFTRYVYSNYIEQYIELKYNGSDLLGIAKTNEQQESVYMTPQELSTLGVLVEEDVL